jgi:hypothetical protein
MFHVDFEDVLYILGLKNRATLHKISQLKIRKFLKSSSQPTTLFHTLKFPLQSVKTWSTGVSQSFQDEHIREDQSYGNGL